MSFCENCGEDIEVAIFNIPGGLGEGEEAPAICAGPFVYVIKQGADPTKVAFGRYATSNIAWNYIKHVLANWGAPDSPNKIGILVASAKLPTTDAEYRPFEDSERVLRYFWAAHCSDDPTVPEVLGAADNPFVIETPYGVQPKHRSLFFSISDQSMFVFSTCLSTSSYARLLPWL